MVVCCSFPACNVSNTFTTARGLKYYRLLACHLVLSNMCQVKKEVRILPCGLALGGILIWLLNATFYRPAEDFGAKDLSQLCCQQQLNIGNDGEDEDDNLIPAMWERGIYFLCDVVTTNATGYRLPVLQTFPTEMLTRIYNCQTLADISTELGMETIRWDIRKAGNPTRVNNRHTKPTRAYHIHREEEPEEIHQIQVAELGVMLENAVRLQGRDVDEGADQPREDDEGEDGVDIQVSRIWAQMFFNIIQAAPNRKGAAADAYCTIPPEAWPEIAQEALFKSKVLPFNAV